MKNDQIRTVIAGMGHYLPDRIVTSEEIEEKIKSQLDLYQIMIQISNL